MRTLPTALLLVAVPVHAQGTAQAEAIEQLKQRKIERFFRKIEADATLDAAQKERLLRLKEGALLGGEYGCIHQALLERYPEYKRADTLLLDERYAAAAERFGTLRLSTDEYLKAYATFRLGLAEMNREHFEPAIVLFREMLNDWGRFVGCDVEAAFYLAVSLGQAREKEEALVAAQRFLDDYPDAPERYRLAMEQMKNELMREWESPLYDLAGRMNEVARRIDNGDTGDGTRGKQGEIVEIIDELIRRAEDQEGNQGQGGQGGQGGRNQGRPDASNPANRSEARRGEGGTGDLRPKAPPKAGEQWGQMRDKEREEVLQALKEKFPDRYRELLEQYNKALAEGQRVTERGDGEPEPGR